MNHVLIDLETLGTKADATIISIGAVRFDLESDKMSDEGFYASISVDSNLDAGRKINESTLLWWLKQTPAAQAVFHEPKMTLEAALHDLREWYPRDCIVWGNGPDFDIAMLEHAFDQFGIQAPWPYWGKHCLRTYRALPGAKKVPKIEPQVAHHALHDAVAEAKHAQAIYKTLFKK